MNQKDVEKKIRDLLKEEGNTEKLKELLPVWRETYKLAMELSGKSFLHLAIFFLFFSLIDMAEVTKASLFDIEFKTLSIPYGILFTLSIITYYRLILLVCFAQTIEEAIRETYYQCYESFQTEGLSDLAVYPSLVQIEKAFENLEDNQSGFFARLAFASMLIESLALIIIPLFGFIWASYALIRSTLISDLWSISIVCVSWLVIFRALLLAIQSLRYAGSAT
jgi:hypothetical protein